MCIAYSITQIIEHQLIECQGDWFEITLLPLKVLQQYIPVDPIPLSAIEVCEYICIWITCVRMNVNGLIYMIQLYEKYMSLNVFDRIFDWIECMLYNYFIVYTWLNVYA